MVDDAGRQNERAADDEVCKIADESGARALEEKLDHDLDKLRRHARDGTEVKRADEHRHLAYIELIKARREEQRQLKEHEHACHAGKDGGVGDVVRVGERLSVAAEVLFGEQRRAENCGNHDDAHDDEAQVFHKIQFSFYTGAKKHPKIMYLRARKQYKKRCFRIFFHPDYTVGLGITPNHAAERLADFTADRELRRSAHPALKMCLV